LRPERNQKEKIKEAKLRYRTPEDKKLITATAAFCSPVVHRCIEIILRKEGYSFERKKKGWEEFYEIKTEDKGDKKAKFYLYNLYLEIASEDRDIELLEWDSRLLDLSFFRKKIADVVFSKIRPLLIILSTNDAEELDKKLTKLAKEGKFARMRMMRFDRGDKNENK